MLQLTVYILALLVASGHASKFPLNEVTCPDQKSHCPDGTTCCQLDDDSYGCCPLPNAVCCSDHVHCCPEGTECHPEEGTCLGATRRYPMYRKLPASSRQPHVHGEGADFEEVSFPSGEDKSDGGGGDSGEVECPDHKSKCPPHTTCCPLDDSTTSNTLYGCCPAEDAVCCEDKVHCCPHGTVCDLEEMRCTQPGSGVSRPWYRKFASTSTARKPSVKAKAVALSPCAASRDDSDEEMTVTPACESGTKCCSSGSASTAYCCPFSDGECCTEASYCCPKGFRCSHYQQCTMVERSGARFSLNAFKSELAPLERALAVGDDEKTTCGDGSQCESLHTCCAVQNPIVEHKTDSYRCCPLSGQATCCASGDSCCPRGYRCVLNGRGCERIASYGARLFLE